MLSRLATAPRICLSCRFGLLQYRTFGVSVQRGRWVKGKPTKGWANRGKGNKETAAESQDPFWKAFAGVRGVNETSKSASTFDAPTQEPRKKSVKKVYARDKPAREAANKYARRAPISKSPPPKLPIPEPHKPKSTISESSAPESPIPEAPVPEAPIPAATIREAQTRESKEGTENAINLVQDEIFSRQSKMRVTMAKIDKWLVPLVTGSGSIFTQPEPKDSAIKINASNTTKNIPKQIATTEDDEPEQDLGQRSEKVMQSLRNLEDDSGLDQKSDISKVKGIKKSKQPRRSGRDSALPDDWEMPQSKDSIDARDDPRTFEDSLLRSEALGIEALGKRVEAVILDNPNMLTGPKRPSIQRREIEAVPGPMIEWQNQISRNPAEVNDLEEGWVMLEEKRISEKRAVTRDEFNDLKTFLLNGFTVRQLTNYYLKKMKEATPLQTDYPWIISMGDWEGGADHHVETMTPKQHLVHMILTDAWRMEIKEELHVVGWVRIFIRTDIAKILSQVSSTFLEDLKNDFLDLSNNEDIALDAEASKIDMFTKKWALPAILNRVDKFLNSMMVTKVSASSAVASDLHEDVLDELGRVTDTNIRHLRNTNELEVSWMPTAEELIENSSHTTNTADTTKSTLETPADVVARLLRTGPGPATTKETQAIILMGSGADQAHVAHTREKLGMSWRDRQRTWFRLYSAAQHSTKQKPEGEAEAEAEAEKKPLQLQIPRFRGKTTTHEVSVTFGHVLHPANPTEPFVKDGKSRSLNKKNKDRQSIKKNKSSQPVIEIKSHPLILENKSHLPVVENRYHPPTEDNESHLLVKEKEITLTVENRSRPPLEKNDSHSLIKEKEITLAIKENRSSPLLEKNDSHSLVNESEIAQPVKEKKSRSPVKKKKKHPPVKENWGRLPVLSTVMPHPAALTELTENLSQIVQRTTIILRFTAKDDNAPEVHLRIPVEPGQALPSDTLPFDATLSAVTPYYLQDVLLPRESVDLRFQGTTSKSLQAGRQPALKAFYAASKLNLIEGHLRTPTQTTISLPKKLVDPESASSKASIGIPYLFAGAEVHQTVEAPWRDIGLRFTSIAAGEHGGFRQELSLRCSKAAYHEQLVQLAREFAEGKYFSWCRGAELMRELPPDEPIMMNDHVHLEETVVTQRSPMEDVTKEEEIVHKVQVQEPEVATG